MCFVLLSNSYCWPKNVTFEKRWKIFTNLNVSTGCRSFLIHQEFLLRPEVRASNRPWGHFINITCLIAMIPVIKRLFDCQLHSALRIQNLTIVHLCLILLYLLDAVIFLISLCTEINSGRHYPLSFFCSWIERSSCADFPNNSWTEGFVQLKHHKFMTTMMLTKCHAIIMH